MSFNSIGDLARSFQLRTEISRLNSDMLRLSGELSSGQKSDIVDAVRGDFRALAGLEKSLSSLDAFEVSSQEAALASEAGQDVLGRIADDSEELTGSLLIVQEATDAQLTQSAAKDARQKFASAVTGLNTIVAGRTIFAGEAYNSPALDDPETILADLTASIAGATSAADVMVAVDAFFAPGGDFETISYLGSTEEADPVALGNGSSADPFAIATDREIVEVLKGLATASVLDLGVLAGFPEEAADLSRTAGEQLLTAGADLVGLRAELGVSQERIDTALTRISAERSSYEMAQREILAADPLETSARLREVEVQLESLYIITGRIYNLSLASYLR